MNTEVSVAKCESYESSVCRKAIEEVLAPIGGLNWVTAGMKIAVKVNLVAAIKPEGAATTHPALLCALIDMLREKGASVTLGDSPGGLFNAPHLNHVYDVTGLRACEAAGASLNQDFSQRSVENPDAAQAKTFQYTAWLTDSDAIIDFCKLKTHGQMGMTCAVKNFFGSIPGTMKPEYHYKYVRSTDFADMLVDLYEFFKPKVCICDAVLGMEGNGPTMGAPRKIGALLASKNGHALDLAGAKILGYQPNEVPTLAAAIKRGLCPASIDTVTVHGDLNAVVQKDVQRTFAQQNVYYITGADKALTRMIDHILSRLMSPHPELYPEMCIGCGKCADICPAKAITIRDKKPLIDRRKCIHCFCCQEFCPKGAMRVQRTAIARILNK